MRCGGEDVLQLAQPAVQKGHRRPPIAAGLEKECPECERARVGLHWGPLWSPPPNSRRVKEMAFHRSHLVLCRSVPHCHPYKLLTTSTTDPFSCRSLSCRTKVSSTDGAVSLRGDVGKQSHGQDSLTAWSILSTARQLVNLCNFETSVLTVKYVSASSNPNTKIC